MYPDMSEINNHDGRIGFGVIEENLNRVISWVAVADSKAQYILTVILAILGYISTKIETIYDIIVKLWLLNRCMSVVIFVMLISGIGSLLAALVISVFIIFPKRKPSSSGTSHFYFRSISQMDSGSFSKDLNSMSEDQVRGELIEQTHNVSLVVSRKFDQLAAAIWLFWAGLVFLIIFAVLFGIEKATIC